MITFDNKTLVLIAMDMMRNPKRYLIAPDGRLYAFCYNCEKMHVVTRYEGIVKQ